MTRRVRLTTYAQTDLDQIFAYIGRDNLSAAERYVRALQERCQFYLEKPRNAASGLTGGQPGCRTPHSR